MKKNFSSNVYVNFEENNLTCKFRAKVRVTGDLWWHLDWKKGSALTSVQVRLLDGHINNITRFKLFIPKARDGADNEIFTSSLISELGFLAPRTFLVSSKINGMTGNYIFQEDLRKEFLVQGSLVVLDVETGNIIAMIGGRQESNYIDYFNMPQMYSIKISYC